MENLLRKAIFVSRKMGSLHKPGTFFCNTVYYESLLRQFKKMKMGKIVAISSSLDPFAETIIQLAKKKNPKVLVIPTAAYDSKIACADTEQRFNQRNCRVDALYLSEAASKQTIIDKILMSDIIYVEGGNTIRMLRLWRKQGVSSSATYWRDL